MTADIIPFPAVTAPADPVRENVLRYFTAAGLGGEISGGTLWVDHFLMCMRAEGFDVVQVARPKVGA